MRNLNTYTLTTFLLIGGAVVNSNAESMPNSTMSAFNSNSYPYENFLYKKKESGEDEKLSTDTYVSPCLMTEFGVESETTGLSQALIDVNFLQDDLNSVLTKSDISIVHEFPEHHYKNYLTFVDYFTKEAKTYKHNISGNLDEFQAQFNSVASKIAELNFDESAIEILKNNTVKFTLLFEQHRILRITKSFDIMNEGSKNQISYSYFENKELISANKNDLEDFIDGFNEYISI
jgi:hypothetical protein